MDDINKSCVTVFCICFFFLAFSFLNQWKTQQRESKHLSIGDHNNYYVASAYNQFFRIYTWKSEILSEILFSRWDCEKSAKIVSLTVKQWELVIML